MEITKSYEIEELREFKKLVHDEWSNVEFSNENETGLVVPKPILAKKEGLIVGGLSYIWHPRPDQSKLGLWVNTVLVSPPYRNHGVGTALVKFAMQEKTPEMDLYTFTEIPNLYLKLGWLLVSTDNKSHVLKCTRKGK